MSNIKGDFYQWFEILRDEGYDAEQAEDIAWRNVQGQCPLPDWYVEQEQIQESEPKPVTKPVTIDEDCEEIPF